MSRKVTCLLQMIGLTMILAIPAAWAQEPPPIRISWNIRAYRRLNLRGQKSGWR